MKTKFYSLLLTPSLILAFSTSQIKAQKLIHFWDFNTTVAGDSLGNAINPLPPSYSTLMTKNPKIVYSRPYSPMMKSDSILDNGSGGSFYYDYSSSNYTYFTASDSALTNEYLKLRNPNAGAYVMLYLPTIGYKNITLSYSISASSSKAANNSVFSYSSDSGKTWSPLTAAMDTFNTGGRMHPDTLMNVDTTTVGSHWRPVAIDFSSDIKTNNCPGFIVRFTSSGANDTSHSGNLRLDNFAIMGDTTTTAINEISAPAGGYNVYPNPATSFVTITSEKYSGNKLITLYNVLGQSVSITENQQKQTTINTSALTQGVYFVEIKETSTGNKYTTKLVKE